MNKSSVTFLTLFIITINFKAYKSIHILNPESDLFRVMKNKLDIVIDNIFNSSKKNKNVLETNKTKLLLTMQEDLKKLTEKNLISYKDLKRAVNSSDRDAMSYIIKLNNVIKEILKNNHNNNSINILNDKHVKGNASVEINDTSKETLKFFEHFIDTINESSSEDIINSIIKPVYDNKNAIYEFQRSRRNYQSQNLKLWSE